MCGIIGIVGKDAVTPRLIEGLRRLEYRGYDSAGVATLVNGHIGRRRAEGKIASLEARVAAEPLAGVTGIAHNQHSRRPTGFLAMDEPCESRGSSTDL